MSTREENIDLADSCYCMVLYHDGCEGIQQNERSWIFNMDVGPAFLFPSEDGRSLCCLVFLICFIGRRYQRSKLSYCSSLHFLYAVTTMGRIEGRFVLYFGTVAGVGVKRRRTRRDGVAIS